MTRTGPIAIVAAALVAAAFLGQAGLAVAMVGLVVGGALFAVGRLRANRMLVADYVERHSFPDDTIEDFACSEAGGATLGQARARMDAWRNGYVAAEFEQRRRRSEAAKKAAATRRRRS